jgi:hypothetical protein
MVNIQNKNSVIKILILIIVLAVFGFIMYYIFEQFKPKCKDKKHMYDEERKICRDICDLDKDPKCVKCTHWDNIKKRCV